AGTHSLSLHDALPISVEWVRQGTLNRLLTTRHTAGLTGLPVAPAVDNLILEGGGDTSLEGMVAATERGLLLTCLWYIREVDPARSEEHTSELQSRSDL